MRSDIASLGLELAAALEEPLAAALFNIHLLGRAQVFADVSGEASGVRRSLSASRLTPNVSLAAVVLEAGLEPLPFEEAIEFWRAKLNLSPAQFAQLSQAARAKAFTIAGGASRQARRQVMDLIDRALSEGLSLGEFQARAAGVIDRAGLSERTPWYWETVYRTNLQTSYAVGRWKQMRDPFVAAERPFLQYFSARLPTSRPSHVEKHGVVLPADDPFWDEWYPPNGFNCYCSVHSVSRRELERDGLSLADSGQFIFRDADDGFQFNPGKSDQI